MNMIERAKNTKPVNSTILPRHRCSTCKTAIQYLRTCPTCGSQREGTALIASDCVRDPMARYERLRLGFALMNDGNVFDLR